ncbi:polysaccharide biosynthesis C-terminal domain-containing protein [Novosphingobium panipatense]
MILAVVVDIALNPILIIGVGPLPALGVAGSAIATALANTAGMLLQIWVIYRNDLPLRLRGPELGYLRPAAMTCATSSAKACRWARRC